MCHLVSADGRNCCGGRETSGEPGAGLALKRLPHQRVGDPLVDMPPMNCHELLHRIGQDLRFQRPHDRFRHHNGTQ